MYQDKEVTTDLSELYSEVNRVYEIGEKGDLCGSDEIDLQLFETEDFDIEYDHIEQSLFGHFEMFLLFQIGFVSSFGFSNLFSKFCKTVQLLQFVMENRSRKK